MWIRRRRKRRGLGDWEDDQTEEDIALVGDWMNEAAELDFARRALREDLLRGGYSRDDYGGSPPSDSELRYLKTRHCQSARASFKKMRDAYGRVRKLQAHPRWHQAIKDALNTDPDIVRGITTARDRVDHAHAVARVAGKRYEEIGCPATDAGPWLLPSALGRIRR